jgi:hypothetical protein
LVGHPSKLIEGVKAYEEIGVDQIICLVQAGKIPHEKIMQSIKLFGEEVISRL